MRALARYIVACVLVFVCVLPFGGAHASTAHVPEFTRYTLTSGDAHITRIDVRTACLGAEDSAAHLRLIGYSSAHAHARYGCARTGY